MHFKWCNKNEQDRLCYPRKDYVEQCEVACPLITCLLINWHKHDFLFIFNLWKDYMERQTRFVSRQPAKVIISMVEAVAESLGLKVHTRHYKVLFLV